MADFKEKYRDEYPIFESFTKRLEELFKMILANSNITYHLVESRTKSHQSLAEKVIRKQEKYKDPLQEITDICAIRIIVYYVDDLDVVEKILNDNFIIDSNNSYNAKTNLTENEFGYLSSHFVISLKKDRAKLPEWVNYKNIKAEIQVRTVLQHAWAAISHQLEYKKNYEIPSVLKRKLFRLAGLIELADEEFQVAKENHKAVENAIKENKPLNNQSISEEINLNTLTNYFSRESELLEDIKLIATEIGFTLEYNDTYFEREKNNYLSDIIKICRIKDIKSISEFDKKLRALNNKIIIDKLERLLQDAPGDDTWLVSIEFLSLLIMILSLSKVELEGFILDWGIDMKDVFMQLADK